MLIGVKRRGLPEGTRFGGCQDQDSMARASKRSEQETSNISLLLKYVLKTSSHPTKDNYWFLNEAENSETILRFRNG